MGDDFPICGGRSQAHGKRSDLGGFAGNLSKAHHQIDGIVN
jgi:hypothetical protein